MIDSIPALALPGLAQSPRSPLTEGFWAAAHEGTLLLQCESCGGLPHPPTGACHRCQSPEWQWTQLLGDGSTFSYTWVETAMSAAFAAVVPHNVCVVELDDVGEPVRFYSNVTGVDRETCAWDFRSTCIRADRRKQHAARLPGRRQLTTTSNRP